MYAREVKGKELNFQVSGMLWQRSLVMRDLETKTLWSHLLGRGMRGELDGVELEMIPATMTSWADWKARYPDTTLLAMSRTADRYDASAWERPERFVYGIPLGAGKPSPAVSLMRLQRDGVVPMAVEGFNLVATHTKDGGSIQVFEANLEGKTLTFSAAEAKTMTDAETGSVWDRAAGKAIGGAMRGKQLREVPGTVSFLKAWQAFYPEDAVVK